MKTYSKQQGDCELFELLSKTIVTLKIENMNGENVNPGPMTCQHNTEIHNYAQTHCKYRGQTH